MLVELAVYSLAIVALLLANAVLVVLYPKYRNDWVLLAYACILPSALHVWLPQPWSNFGLFAVCGLVDAEILRTGFYRAWKFRYVALAVHMLSAIAVPFAPPLVSATLAISAPLLLMAVGEIRYWRKFGFARDVSMLVAVGAVVADSVQPRLTWILVPCYVLAFARMLLCTASLPPWKRFYTNVADLADFPGGMRAVCVDCEARPEVWAAMFQWMSGKRRGRDPESYSQARNTVLAEIQGDDPEGPMCAERAQRILLTRYASRTRLGSSWALQREVRRDLMVAKRNARIDAILGVGLGDNDDDDDDDHDDDDDGTMGVEFEVLSESMADRLAPTLPPTSSSSSVSVSADDSSEDTDSVVTYAKWGEFVEP